MTVWGQGWKVSGFNRRFSVPVSVQPELGPKYFGPEFGSKSSNRKQVFQRIPVLISAVAETVSVPEPAQPVSRPKLADRKNGLMKTVISFASGLRF